MFTLKMDQKRKEVILVENITHSSFYLSNDWCAQLGTYRPF